jgi:chromosome segregation ATPase
LIAEVRREVQTYQRYGEEAATRRIEIQRLAGDIARLQKQAQDAAQEAEESRRGSKLLEEHRHQDLNRLTELQAQTADLLKRFEATLPRLQYLEQLHPRLAELQASAQEVQLEQSKHMEKMQFLEAQIERQVRGWSEEIGQYRQRLDEFARQMEQYGEDHQLIKKAMEDLTAFQEQIKRQQHEMSELQRLTQSHQKSEFTEWQAQAEQFRQQQQADWDRQWSDYDKIMADWTERIMSMQGQVAEHENRLRQLLQMAEEYAELRATSARDWQDRFEQIISED